MATVTITIPGAQSDPTFPAGTVTANFQVTISGGVVGGQPVPPVSQTVPASPLPVSVSFPNVAVEDAGNQYTASAQSVDASGNALGAPSLAQFSVAAPLVAVTLPGAITVAVA